MFWGGRVGFRQESAGAERVDGLRFCFMNLLFFIFFYFFLSKIGGGVNGGEVLVLVVLVVKC